MIRNGQSDEKFEKTNEQNLIPLGFEPRTSRVLGERDDHYTMESQYTPHSFLHPQNTSIGVFYQESRL